MIRGFNLSLAASVVAILGVAGAFAFTPSIAPIPDVIIGNNTPIDTLTPGEIATPGDVIETDATVFDWEVLRLNIFDLVDDQPNVPGETSDENLIYQFSASPDLGFGYTQAQRIGITGDGSAPTAANRIGGTPTTVAVDSSGLLRFKDLTVSSDEDNESPIVMGTLTYPFSNGAGTFDVTADLIDVNTLTLTVTNNAANSETGDFFVFTVSGPFGGDSISGGGFPGPQTDDLSAWVYLGSGSLGSALPNDSTITGTYQADAASDGSVNDLRVASTTLTGSSNATWSSPAGLIPFVADQTYHVGFTTTASAFGGTSPVQFRGRMAYGTFGALGNASISANGATAPPSTAGRLFSAMYDVLDVASETASDGFAPFNSQSLAWDFIDVDFGNAFGNGSFTVENVEISAVNTAVVEGQAQSEVTVANFTTDTAEVGANTIGTGPDVTVALAAGSATLTAPFGNGSGANDGTGTVQTLALNGVAIPAFTPTNSDGSDFYRGTATIDWGTVNAATPVPLVRMNVQTNTFGLTGDQGVFSTTSNGVNPHTQGSGDTAAYLVLPEGGDLAGGTGPDGFDNIGTQVLLSVELIDSAATAGGAITVSAMELSRVPANILP